MTSDRGHDFGHYNYFICLLTTKKQKSLVPIKSDEIRTEQAFLIEHYD